MARTFVLRTGQAEIVGTEWGSGPAVVLLHAGGETREIWAPVAVRLEQAGFRAVAIDQRGHGETGGVGKGLSDFVDDACAVVDELAAPVLLVGCSLGGFVSLLTGLRKAGSGAVAGIVLVDVVPDPDPKVVRAHLQSVEAASGKCWNWELIEDILSQRALLCAAAAGSLVPIALVRGEQGRVLDGDVARLRQGLPALEVRCVAGAGHLVARDRPELLGDVLIELFGALGFAGRGPE